MHIRKNLNILLLAISLGLLGACGGGGGGGSSTNTPTDTNTDTPTDNNTDTSTNDNPSDANQNTNAFDQRSLIANLAGVMRDDFLLLNASVSALKQKADAYCAGLGNANESTLRQEAQNSFKSTMQPLQTVAMYSLGPSLEEDSFRQLYSWPLTSSCSVDTQLAINSTDLNTQVFRRGLDIVEYLLFVEPSANHTCENTNADLDQFNLLSSTEKQQRRCAFMQAVVDDVASNAQTLADAWDVDKGNYAATLTTSSDSTATLNQITDAMFYFEEVVKENKLDAPLGGSQTNTPPSCGAGALCPADVESPYARISKENMLVNVKAFQKLFQGGSDKAGVGFDDWLIAEGEAELANTMASDIQRIINDLETSDGSFYDALSTDANAWNALLLGPVQTVSNQLRFLFMPALGLQLPATSASDTD